MHREDSNRGWPTTWGKVTLSRNIGLLLEGSHGYNWIKKEVEESLLIVP